jgi:hypothetical protein
VEGSGRHEVESRLHIHPALEVDGSMQELIIRDRREILARISLSDEESIEIIDGWYSPEFGTKEKCAVLRTRHNDVSLPYEVGWQIKVED